MKSRWEGGLGALGVSGKGLAVAAVGAGDVNGGKPRCHRSPPSNRSNISGLIKPVWLRRHPGVEMDC